MIIGFLMVGGASSRMRRNKAQLPCPSTTSGGQGQNFADYLCALLARHCDEVGVVGSSPISLPDTFWLPDAIHGVGPLGGLLSALRCVSAKTAAEENDVASTSRGAAWALVLSCDTPFVSSELLLQLLAAADEPAVSQQPDVVLPRTRDGRLHPLCALYHARVTESLEDLLAAGGRATGSQRGSRAPSMHRFVEGLSVKTIEPHDDHWLRNLNSMQDYLAALAGRLPHSP